MDNKPLFSILIANYNNAKYIEEAIQSVYDQTYTNWEIIIVDDASTDLSTNIYDKYAKDTRIKLALNSENQGCGYTKRRCVELSNGKYCAFLDPDDKISDDSLQLMIDTFAGNEELTLVYSTFYFCDEAMNIKSRFPRQKIQSENDPHFTNIGGCIGHFCAFKKASYDKTEGINPYLLRAVDQDLYLKLYDIGTVHYLDKALYYYRIHDRGISTMNNKPKAFFWHWIVLMNRAERLNVNYEESFYKYFVLSDQYENLENRYERLLKYEKLNNFLAKIKRKLTFK